MSEPAEIPVEQLTSRQARAEHKRLAEAVEAADIAYHPVSYTHLTLPTKA